VSGPCHDDPTARGRARGCRAPHASSFSHHPGRRRGRRRRMRGRGRQPPSGWTAPSAPAACPRRLSPPAASTASPSSPARSGTAATVARSRAKSRCAASSTQAAPMSRPLGFHRSRTAPRCAVPPDAAASRAGIERDWAAGLQRAGGGHEDLAALVDVGGHRVAAIAGGVGIMVREPFRHRKPRSFAVLSSMSTA
jgi:hypothetical protein